MSERQGTFGEADWAVDSARSDELAASGPPERVHAALELRNAKSMAPPPISSTPPPPTVPLGRTALDAPTRIAPEGEHGGATRGDEPPPTRPSPSARSSRRLGKYEFIATLGRGGMADVHLAVSMGPAGFSKLLVIKRLRPNIADEPEFRNMLLDEARLAARLNHRNIVQTNEVGLVDDEYFIAMEYLDGQPLSRVLSRAREQERTLPLAFSLWILTEVLAGLHYAHELVDYDGSPLNVVHRDVSPHNIFITYDGQVKIVDFGIALAARRVVETQAGTLKGKIAYMAPEQAFSPSSEIDRRADVFSVGIILWEMIANRRLWRGLTDPQIISRLLREVPDVRTARPDVSFELARICNQALARTPDRRYTTAAELRTELERYAERLGEQVTAQQVGELVSELFASERAEIRAIIDRQLKGLRERGPSEAEGVEVGRPSMLPTFPVREPLESYPPDDNIGSSPSASARRSITPAPQSVARASGSTPPPPRSTPPPRSNPPPGTLHAVVRPEPEPPLQPEPVPQRSPQRLVAVGVAVAVIGGATLYLQLREAGAPGGATPAPAPTSTVTAPTPPAMTAAPAPNATSSAGAGPVTGEPRPSASEAAPQSTFIRARIKVMPAEAKILVDGSELPSNPFDGKFIKDGAAHRIEMQALGHVAQRRMVVFDNDLDMDVTLYVANKGSGPASAPSATPVAPPAEPPAPATTDEAVPPPKPDPY